MIAVHVRRLLTFSWRATPRTLVRFFVCLHVAALMLLPKDSFGLTSLRPEDLTAVLLLLLVGWLTVSGRVLMPRTDLTVVTAAYVSYFLLALVSRDFSSGHFGALVFWVKETAYILLGYLVWRAYASDPEAFLTVAAWMAVPNLLLGAVQLLGASHGMYGVSPLGHETSPASSGMVYFSFSLVMFFKLVRGAHRRLFGALLILSAVLVFASGSKVAVVGALCFYGWYLALVLFEKPDVRALRQLAWFGAASVAGILLSISAANLSSSWRGLGRYRGLGSPIQVIINRGIWWKVNWVNDPLAVLFGAGYSPPHIQPDASYGYGMAMDNQVLYYFVTGGAVALALYAILLTVIYKAAPAESVGGKVLRSLVVSYAFMGLGGEVLQLSVHGNVFWMMVGLSLAIAGYPRSWTRSFSPRAGRERA